MKKILNFLVVILATLIIIASLAFAFLEARLLFSLEWTIYQSNFFAFLRYLFRFLLCLVALASPILYFISYKQKNSKSIFLFRISQIQLPVIAFFALFLTTNFVNIAVFTLGPIFNLLTLITIPVKK